MAEDEREFRQILPDGRRLVAAGNNHIAMVFDVETGSPLLTLDDGTTKPEDRWVASAEFSPDGKQIVTMNNFKVRTWDAESSRSAHQGIHQTEEPPYASSRGIYSGWAAALLREQ